MILNIYLTILLVFLVIVICGIFLQKEIFAKLLFLNTGTSLVSLVICFLGSYKVNSSYIDIALIYFLLSVVGSTAYLKYFLHKHKKEQQNEQSQ
ncbi:MAG: monovalent cation/H+ antiporter complex subunit F [Rickettsiaceae bacterium]